MGHKVTAIGITPVRGGVEVIKYGQSSRGTRFIMSSVVILREGKTVDEYKLSIKVAAGQMLPTTAKTGS